MNTTTLLAPVALSEAPETVRGTLEQIEKSFGQIPNLMAGMANTPSLLHGYLALSAEYDRGTLSPQERQYVLLAISEENDCRFCSAAHAMILKAMMKESPETVLAVREGRSTGNSKLDALTLLARALASKKGQSVETEISEFLAQGFTESQIGEVIVGLGLKAMSNTLDNIAHYELGAFASEAR